MTSSLVALSAILVAGLAMWDAWVTYRGDRTWRNLAALVIRGLAFCAAVQTNQGGLSERARAVLLAAIEALSLDFGQLRLDFPGL